MALPSSGWVWRTPTPEVGSVPVALPLPVPHAVVYHLGSPGPITSDKQTAETHRVVRAGGVAVENAYGSNALGGKLKYLRIEHTDVYAAALADWAKLAGPRVWIGAAPLGIRFAHLEVWSDIEANGGVALAFSRDATAVVARMGLDGQESLLAELPRHVPVWDQVREKRALRVRFTDGSFEEWRIVRTDHQRSDRNAAVGTIECDPIRYDLAFGMLEKLQANGQVDHHYELYGLEPLRHVQEALTAARAYFVAADVQAADALDFGYQGTTPLAALLAISEATGMELHVERNQAGSYNVSLVKERGAEHPVPQLLYGRNALGMRKRLDSSRQATRVYPFGAEQDGFRQSMADAEWEIASISGTALQLAGGPIAFDGQLDGLYVEKSGGGAIQQITATSYQGQTITVADAAGFVATDLVQIRRGAAGEELTYLENPAAIAAYGGQNNEPVSAPLDVADLPPIDNLIGNAYLSEWAADGSLPLGFFALGAAAITKGTEKLHRRYGAASARVVAAAADEGIESGAYPVRPTDRKRYGSVQVSLWLVAGKVRLEWLLSDGTSTVIVPDPAGTRATTTVKNQWADGDKQLAIAGIDLFDHAALGLASPVREFAVRLASDGGAAEWYLDAVQVTQLAGGAEGFFDGRASNELWLAANRHLREWSLPRHSYECRLADLHRTDPEKWPNDRIYLGGYARVGDPQLAIDVKTRISALELDYLEPGNTAVQLAQLPPDLTQITIGVGTTTRRRLSASSVTAPGTGDGGGGDTTDPGTGGGSTYISPGSISNLSAMLEAVGVDRHMQLRWDTNSAIDQASTMYSVRITEYVSSDTAMWTYVAALKYGAADEREDPFSPSSNPTVGKGSFAIEMKECNDPNASSCKRLGVWYKVELMDDQAPDPTQVIKTLTTDKQYLSTDRIWPE